MVIPYEKIDTHVREYYKGSFMSHTKWKKLLHVMVDNYPAGFALHYRLIHGDSIHEALLNDVDDQFFIEPILYKEVEWIEFPDRFEDWRDPNNRKAGKITKKQNLTQIRNIIHTLGELESENLESSIRVYGYK